MMLANQGLRGVLGFGDELRHLDVDLQPRMDHDQRLQAQVGGGGMGRDRADAGKVGARG